MHIFCRESNQKFPGCYSNWGIMEESFYFFTTMEEIIELEETYGPEQARIILMGLVYMTPQGVLVVQHKMFQKDEFCLYNYM